MRRSVNIAACVLLAVPLLLAPADAVTSYRWSFANPNNGQLAAFQTAGGVVTVASVHTTNGCQTPFLLPVRTKFLYDLKIRTATGPIFCTHIVQDRLVAMYEAGKTPTVHVKTLDGTVPVTVQPVPMHPPLP